MVWLGMIANQVVPKVIMRMVPCPPPKTPSLVRPPLVASFADHEFLSRNRPEKIAGNEHLFLLGSLRAERNSAFGRDATEFEEPN